MRQHNVWEILIVLLLLVGLLQNGNHNIPQPNNGMDTASAPYHLVGDGDSGTCC